MLEKQRGEVGLLGSLEWNGLAMVTVGEGQGRGALGRAAEKAAGLFSEHFLIKRLSRLRPENEHGAAAAWSVK